MKIDKLQLVLTFRNVESCCVGDLKEALTKTFDGFEEEGEHSVVHVESCEDIQLLANPKMEIREFMASFIGQMMILVQAWDEKMPGSKMLTTLGQPYASIRAGLGFIHGYAQRQHEAVGQMPDFSTIETSVEKLMTILPLEMMREVAAKIGIPGAAEMDRDQLIAAIRAEKAKHQAPEAQA